MLMPARVEAMLSDEHTRSVEASASGTDSMSLRSVSPMPFCTSAEKPPMSTKMVSVNQYVSALSGGNKQKVVLARWLGKQSDILVLDSPTRGIDIKVKAAIYALLEQMRKENKAILIISEEIMGVNVGHPLFVRGQNARFTIANFMARIVTTGASLVALEVPGRDGELVDVALGFDDLTAYQHNEQNIGAIVGRVANRTAGARFTLNGISYQLAANEGENNNHSGPDSWTSREFSVVDEDASHVTLALKSKAGDQGFPGSLDVLVTYELVGCALEIRVCARPSEPTLANIIHHGYYNLNGHGRRTARALSWVGGPSRLRRAARCLRASAPWQRW